MDIPPLEEGDAAAWDEFCRTSNDAWFRHTTHWLDYVTAYSDADDRVRESFMVTNNGHIKAIMPVVVETTDGVAEISMGGDYGAGPALVNDITWKHRKRLLKTVFGELDNIVERHDVARTRLQIPSLCNRRLDGTVTYNYLNRFGFADTSYNTRVVDLTKSLDDLRSDMRRGHSQSIDEAADILDATVFHAENVTREDFDRYKQCHIADAGEQTRPDETFERMYDWITDDAAFLVGAQGPDDYAGFSLFTVHDGRAYYASSARNPASDLYDEPVGHYLQWAAMKWMKEQGYTDYDVGHQYFTRVPPHLASEKKQNISYFKRGFGGTTQTVYAGEMFHSAEFYRKVASDRMDTYAGTLADDD